jgi:hypothetical protein
MNGPALIKRLNEWTPEQLAPYAGKFVAWSEDGEKVLAFGSTPEERDAEACRLRVTDYVGGYVPTAEEIEGGFR